MAEFKGERARSPILIEDIDQAVVDAYSNELSVQIRGREVPTVYATQERFAQMQNQKGLRDDNGTLILPLISVRRTGVDLIPEYYRESAKSSDQLTLNKKIQTLRNSNRRVSYINGYLNAGKATPKAYEYTTMDYPEWYEFKYEIILWSSFISDMNQMQEQLLESYRGFYRHKNFRFYGEIEGPLTDASNVQDFTADERIIKSTHNIRVEAHFIRPESIQTHKSAQTFTFNTEVVGEITLDAVIGENGEIKHSEK